MRLDPLCWPPEQLGQALEAVARRSGLEPRPVTLPSPGSRNEEELGRWLELAAEELGLEAEPAEASYADLDAMLRGCGPGLLRVALDGGPRFLAVLEGGRRRLRLLGPDLQVHRIEMEAVRTALCSKLEAPLAGQLESMLAAAGVAARRRARSLAVLLRARLGAERIGGCWLLRQPPQAAFLGQMRRAGLMRLLGGLFALRGGEYLLLLGSWWMIGRSALQGRFDPGWMLAWALMLLTMVPLQLLEIWWQGRLAVGAGSLLKRRLLHGALRLDPEAIRREGAGQLLGRVIESAAVESLALGGGLLALISLVELVLAGMVLAAGAGGRLHLALFAAWTALTGLLGWRYLVQRRLWTQERLGMTNELVERMVGHRTRLAQEAPELWHEGEDQALDRYLGSSAGMDRSTALLWVLVPRGWLVAGVAGLAPAFVSGSASPGSLAVALGGILLAERGLQRLGNGLISLAGAAISWEQVAPLFHASAKALDSAVPSAVPPAAQEPVLLDAHELWFRHRPRGESVLKGCSLRIRPGERLLLEGPSGGGKSTLASLLSGLREQESGLLLLGGLDRRTLGAEGWRRRVATAPQFHENHVLTETFAFNVLMGRRWPPHQEDMEEAERVCRELGLGELLERMPAGLLQMVGETGWQLSHGERSRLYIARALLQRADAIVLDESFAALDPENLRRALECVLRRAPALLVIAHP